LLVDSHCHLDRLDEAASGDLQTILSRARSRGIEKFLCIATNLDGFENIKAITKDNPDVFCTAGIHPLQEKQVEMDQQRLLQQASQSKVIAVGETGLDYYYSPDNTTWQQQSLRQHIEVAKEVAKPLIIHSRDAREDTLSILREEGAQQVGGILHCFTESLEMAKAAIDLGFYVSFSGIVTFKTADPLRDVARQLPLDRILVETDCPWLAPVPYRGKENQPAYVVEVAQQMANLFSVSYEEMAERTTENFYRLFPQTRI